ncbi:MAG TPA: Rieske (2Fe-2S) protein [Chryseosolibacter sp.]|nr:Rieske (2Fe-2S) protein [Chryseosolibacter sp.]
MEWIRVFSSVSEAEKQFEPGKPRLLIIGKERICVLRTIGGAYRAFQDACTHNGESLSKGHINYRNEIICPWHNYCFDSQTGREIQGRSSDLVTYPVKADSDGFFIGI